MTILIWDKLKMQSRCRYCTMNMTSCQGREHSEDTVAMNLGDTVGASVIENARAQTPLK